MTSKTVPLEESGQPGSSTFLGTAFPDRVRTCGIRPASGKERTGCKATKSGALPAERRSPGLTADWFSENFLRSCAGQVCRSQWPKLTGRSHWCDSLRPATMPSRLTQDPGHAASTPQTQQARPMGAEVHTQSLETLISWLTWWTLSHVAGGGQISG